jgi:hypothetical protein
MVVKLGHQNFKTVIYPHDIFIYGTVVLVLLRKPSLALFLILTGVEQWCFLLVLDRLLYPLCVVLQWFTNPSQLGAPIPQTLES